MNEPNLTTAELGEIDELIDFVASKKSNVQIFLEGLKSCVLFSDSLRPLVHSTRSRIKDPDHLRDKLRKKVLAAKQNGLPSPFTKENIFSKINDVAGFRILHLHSRQFEAINAELLSIFEEQKYYLVEPPSARTWDDETRDYFTRIGVTTVASSSMYTSVHYVISPNTRVPLTCEIQVRTLMEEVWGEVDHTMNYPVKSGSLSCQEQIKALARATSSCSRLVDSIFSTHADFINQAAALRPARKRLLNR